MKKLPRWNEQHIGKGRRVSEIEDKLKELRQSAR